MMAVGVPYCFSFLQIFDSFQSQMFATTYYYLQISELLSKFSFIKSIYCGAVIIPSRYFVFSFFATIFNLRNH